MSTNTIDPFVKIARIEKMLIEMPLIDEKDKYDFGVLFSEMQTRTKVAIGTIEAKEAKWCERMHELEAIHEYHKRKSNNKF